MKTHGLRGEFVLAPYQIIADYFPELEKLIIVTDEGILSPLIEKIRPHKGRFITKFKGYDSIEQVESLRNADIYVSEEELDDDIYVELFIRQVDGISIIGKDDEPIGTLKEVMETPGHPVFVITTDKNKEIMIPAVEKFILDINTEDLLIKIDPPEGIFEIYED